MGPATAHLYRLYDGSELGDDGYPPVWHLVLKHEVRADAGNRCVRCSHPYPGERVRFLEVVASRGEWSDCDDRCDHAGEIRVVGPPNGPNEFHDLCVESEEIAADAETIRAYLSNDYLVQARWRILTVHHLDGNKANCRWWNLAALCQRCHLEIQGKVRMDRRWLHEHSPWFRPYVAAYYAFVYLGEDVTREQAVARMAELLELEHRQEAIL